MSNRDDIQTAVAKENDPQLFPHKVPGTINVIVYDDSGLSLPPDQVPDTQAVGFRPKDAFTLSFWWKVGGFLDSIQGFADVVIGASTWDKALQGVVDAVDRAKGTAGSPARIASLQFWGHGADGAAFMGGEALRRADIQPGGTHAAVASQIRDRMHDATGSVWFRSCNVFRKAAGHSFASAAADAFGAPVVGHTFTTWVFQSGTMVLRPGDAPDWSTSLGVSKKKRKSNDLVLSDPLRRRTVTMFRLHPPLRDVEFIPGKSVLNIIARLFT